MQLGIYITVGHSDKGYNRKAPLQKDTLRGPKHFLSTSINLPRGDNLSIKEKMLEPRTNCFLPLFGGSTVALDDYL